MTYRELIELYKKGSLSKDETAKVEADIEKQEAISEYLADSEEALLLDLPEELPLPENDAADFAKMIKKSIRLAFLKLGIVVLILAISATLFVQFALPNIVSSRYYNPGEIIGTTTYGSEMNRISRDIAVFTELTLPGYYRQFVTVNDRGYGEYDINVLQEVSFNDNFTDVSGRIEKGQLALYSNSLLRRPAGNIFYWFDARNAAAEKNINDYFNTEKPLSQLLPAETVKQHQEVSKDDIASMDENEKYIAYITLDKQMPYENFIAWAEKSLEGGAIWCAPRTSDDLYPDNLGFYYNIYSSTDLVWDKEKYPNLFSWLTDMEDTKVKKLRKDMKTEIYMKSHFTSLLRYMDDSEDFRKLLENCPGLYCIEDYSGIIDYIDENGLNIYGFAVMTDKKGAEKMLRTDNVYGMQVSKLI